MRREGKPGFFKPSEVPAQTWPARVTMPAPTRRRRRATRAVGAQAKRPRSGDDVYARAEMLAPARERMRPGDNVCARATTGGTWEGCFFTNTALLRRRLRPGDDVCVHPCNDGCRAGGVFFHKHPKLQRSADDVCVRATTVVHGR